MSYDFPTIPFAPDKLIALTNSLMDDGVQYKLGAKANPLSLQAGQFDSIDCSGFARWGVFHGAGIKWPDGSVTQHEYVDTQGFKKSTVEAGLLMDNAIRIAFLKPVFEDDGVTLKECGHVMFILNGYTCESHGHHGPDRRKWLSLPFMSECEVYVLTAPTG